MRRCFFIMPEFTRIITALHADDAADGAEEPAATRERLKACFPPGAARRMTQLGMLVGAALARVAPGADDAIIHATQFGEGRALESFLESFPAASPTGFQTSIHPGAVQQGMIRRAQPVREFFPMAGGAFLPGQALLAAMLSPAPRVVLCGGEERGTWLREVGAAAGETFAYALALEKPGHKGMAQRGAVQRGTGVPPVDGEAAQTHGQDARAPVLGRVALAPADEPAAGLPPAEWFALLRGRKNFDGIAAPGWRLRLTWSDA
jgi:hypothetical protein